MQISYVLFPTNSIVLAAVRINAYRQELFQLLFIRLFIDIGSSTWLGPGLALQDEIVEGGKPRIDWGLDVLELRDFIVDLGDILGLIFIVVVEVIHDYIGGRTNLDVFLLVGKVVEQIRVNSHRNLLAETHRNVE